jgi:hypothetical protein
MNSIAGVVLAIIILQSGNCSAACLHARKTEGADQAREYIIRVDKDGQRKNAEVRELLWCHWNEKQPGSLVVTWVSKGRLARIHLFLNPNVVCRGPQSIHNPIKAALHCFSCPKPPSVALHVVECSFQSGFESLRFWNLKSLTRYRIARGGRWHNCILEGVSTPLSYPRTYYGVSVSVWLRFIFSLDFIYQSSYFVPSSAVPWDFV